MWVGTMMHQQLFVASVLTSAVERINFWKSNYALHRAALELKFTNGMNFTIVIWISCMIDTKEVEEAWWVDVKETSRCLNVECGFLYHQSKFYLVYQIFFYLFTFNFVVHLLHQKKKRGHNIVNQNFFHPHVKTSFVNWHKGIVNTHFIFFIPKLCWIKNYRGLWWNLAHQINEIINTAIPVNKLLTNRQLGAVRV